MNWRPMASGRSSSSDIVSARTFFVLPMGEMFGEDVRMGVFLWSVVG